MFYRLGVLVTCYNLLSKVLLGFLSRARENFQKVFCVSSQDSKSVLRRLLHGRDLNHERRASDVSLRYLILIGRLSKMLNIFFLAVVNAISETAIRLI